METFAATEAAFPSIRDRCRLYSAGPDVQNGTDSTAEGKLVPAVETKTLERDMPIRTLAGATGYSRPGTDAGLNARRQQFLARLEALNSQLDGSTLEAALALMVAEYQAEARTRRQALAMASASASASNAATIDLGPQDDLDELTARIELVATVRERIGARDDG